MTYYIESPMRFSGHLTAATDKKGVFRARYVRAGKLKAAGGKESNIEIAAEALREAVSLGMFDGKAVFVDHAGFFENPSVRNLAGRTHNSSWNEAEKSVEGEILFYASGAWVADLVREILTDQVQAPDIGLSMVFWPRWKPADKKRPRDNHDDPRVINGVNHVESVDIVFEPAADGRILQALSTIKKVGVNPTPTSLIGEKNMPEEMINNSAEQAQSEDELAQMWLPALAKAAGGAMIAASGLPAASREKLLERTYQTPSDVEKAIDDERAYLAKLSEAKVIDFGGVAPRGGHIQVGLDGIERVKLALEALLLGTNPGKDIPPLSGIREAYMLLSGDYEMTGVFHPERIRMASVNSSTMAGMVANALNKVLINEFQNYPRWWEPFTLVQDFSSLQQAKFITLGGIGELPTVAEGAAYTELDWDDQTETADFVKKGGYLGITIEAIDKDDTRRLQSAPRALAQAAWLTLGKTVSSIFTSNAGVGPTMSDSVALFDASHGNLGSTALSVTEWAVVRTAMRKQTELNSSERLGALTAPKFLLVPPDLEITALKVLASEADYSYALANGTAAPVNVFAEGNEREARLMSARERVIVIDLWTDTNNWAAVADPRLYPSIGIGFRYGRTPEVFSVASPTAGLMFSNDTMPVKVRYFFAVGATDYRGLYKENVA